MSDPTMNGITQNILDTFIFAPEQIDNIEKELDKQRKTRMEYIEKYKKRHITRNDVNIILQQWGRSLHTHKELKKLTMGTLATKTYNQIHKLFMGLVLVREQAQKELK